MQQLSAGTQVAGVIAVFGEEGYDKDKIAYDKLLILRMKKTMLKLSMKFIL